MIKSIGNRFFRVVILALFYGLSAMLPEVLGEPFKAMSERYLGPYYYAILSVVFLLLFILVYLKPELMDVFMPKQTEKDIDRYDISGTDASRNLLQKAKEAVGEADVELALNILSKLHSNKLDAGILSLKARLNRLRQKQIQGVLSYDNQTKTENEIISDVNSLIRILEREISQTYDYYESIKAVLRKRYQKRLSQKLSQRQPVNLRLLPSVKGSSRQAAESFVQYNENEIPEKLIEYYEKSKGRLLLIGDPGVGKTTLLLQLVLELLEKESNYLPVVLNLARWNNNFPNLESWIHEILPSEMGLVISKKAATEIISQNRLILLLDGFDEVAEEYRGACLEAIGNYGFQTGRHFVISSRINEYIKTQKTAPVNSQIEVGHLDIAQLENQLEKADIDKQPEARRLLAGIRGDKLLRSISTTPFYFNTLQLIFAKGKHYDELKFQSSTIEERQVEVVERFIDEEIKTIHGERYSSQQARRYLAFFASRLNRENLVDFELTDLQYNWWEWGKGEEFSAKFIEYFAAHFFLSIILTLLLGTPYAFLYESSYGMVFYGFIFIYFWVFIALFIILANLINAISGKIVAIFLWTLLSILIIVPIFSLLFGLLFGIFSIIYSFTFAAHRSLDIFPSLISVFKTGFVLSIIIGVLTGRFIKKINLEYPKIISKDILIWNANLFWISFKKNLHIPILLSVGSGLIYYFSFFEADEEFAKALKLIAKFFFGFSLFFIAKNISYGLVDIMSGSYGLFIQAFTPYQRFKASAKKFYFSILQHWHLLCLFSKKDLLPRRIVPFLNDMVEHNILESDGASWRFRHRIIQDYFASQWKELQ